MGSIPTPSTMDPRTVLTDLLNQLSEDDPDRDEICESLRNLHNWIKKGGFVPQVSSYRNSNDPTERLYYINE